MGICPIIVFLSLFLANVFCLAAGTGERKFFVEAGAVFSDIYTPKKPDGKYTSDTNIQLGIQGRMNLGSWISLDPFLSYPITSGKDGGSSTRSYVYVGSPAGFKIINGGNLLGQLHLGPALLMYQMKSNAGEQTSRAWALDLGADISYDRWKISLHTLWQQILSKTRNGNALLTIGAGF